MAKKKKSIELAASNISFILEKESYKVIRYYPSAMTLDVIAYDENGVKIGPKKMPFAYIPKEIKKIIKPT